MSSKRQIEANRRNAQNSTGPRTAEGEAVSRMSATRHGFTAKHNTLPFENNAKFLAEHQPATPTELVQVEQMVTAFWRLRSKAQPEPQQPAKERVPAPAQCPDSGSGSFVQIVRGEPDASAADPLAAPRIAPPQPKNPRPVF